MSKNTKLATIAVCITMFLWGISGSMTKIALRELTPSFLAFLRFLIAGILLLLISYKKYGTIQVSKETHVKLLICGIVGYTIYFLFENYGFSMMPAANGTIILASIPLFTILMEVIWYKTPVGFNKGLGVLVSMLGVILVIGKSISIGGESKEIIGSFLMLGAAISWAIYSIINKGFDPKVPTITITAYQMLYGTIFLFPVFFIENIQLQMISGLTMFSLFYLAILSSALGCFLYLYSLKELGASNTNVYINLMPFVGVFGAFVILGESLSLIQYLGGAVIVFGVYLVNHKSKSKTQKIALDA